MPGGQIASWTTPIERVDRALLRLLLVHDCQITPAAKSEIAIGMKTAVLNATAQRTRSVSTAKTSPIAVTSAGTTATQIALFSIAVRIDGVVKSAW